MRFAYLLLCDAASSGAEGKVNLLGVGVRKIKPPTLPTIASITLAGAVEGTVDESAPVPFEIVLIDPDGTSHVVAHKDQTELPTVADIADVPVQFLFVVNMTRTYEQAGRYTFRVAYGDLSEEYAFVVEPTEEGVAAGDPPSG